MPRLPERAALAATAIAVVALALAACAEESDFEPPPTGFERALESVGEGVSPAGSGFGWIDLERFRDRSPRERARFTLALGPGGDDLLLRPRATAGALGADPRDAATAVSISGSYTLGVRFDGIVADLLAKLMRDAGARHRQDGEWRLLSLGGFAESEVRGPLAALGPYSSRVAIGPDAVVLARFAPARAALMGDGESPLSDPSVALAASCLGPVEAARTLPGTFTHNKETSPELLAAGRAPAGSETICAIGDSSEVAGHADAMSRALEPEARDPVTGEPLRELVADASVETLAGDGVGAARATLDPAPSVTGGFVFGAIVRGSLLTYTGSEPPISRGVARRARRGGE